MSPYAQTNVQLYNQLRSDGYAAEDILAVGKAYEMATTLFADRFRPSGKTIFEHLIGTASILASLRAPVSLVITGLLHATYSTGDFGNANWSLSAKRRRLRQKIGDEIEDLVAAYHAFPWNTQAILAAHRNFSDLKPVERDMMLVRLANDLEDNLDLAVLYCPNRDARLEYLRRCGPAMTDMARWLDYPRLADELARSHEAQITIQNRDDFPIVTDSHNDWALPPRSCRRRLSARVRMRVMPFWRRVERKIRSLRS